MIRPIMKDPLFLARPAREATEADLPIARDLLETLEANRRGCVGMAANMIGEAVAIIAFDNGGRLEVMLNPTVVKKAGPYQTEEGCLSLEGLRSAQRWQVIRVRYTDMALRSRMTTYTGWTAQIIQHELDHLQGVLI